MVSKHYPVSVIDSFFLKRKIHIHVRHYYVRVEDKHEFWILQRSNPFVYRLSLVEFGAIRIHAVCDDDFYAHLLAYLDASLVRMRSDYRYSVEYLLVVTERYLQEVIVVDRDYNNIYIMACRPVARLNRQFSSFGNRNDIRDRFWHFLIQRNPGYLPAQRRNGKIRYSEIPDFLEIEPSSFEYPVQYLVYA